MTRLGAHASMFCSVLSQQERHVRSSMVESGAGLAANLADKLAEGRCFRRQLHTQACGRSDGCEVDVELRRAALNAR